jgi:hypothetical protein
MVQPPLREAFFLNIGDNPNEYLISGNLPRNPVILLHKWEILRNMSQNFKLV